MTGLPKLAAKAQAVPAPTNKAPANPGPRVKAQGLFGLRHHLPDERQHAAHMVAAGQLGHHAAIGFMHGGLGVKRLGDQLRHGLAGLGANQGHACLIT
jgi:hypothetical protein